MLGDFPMISSTLKAKVVPTVLFFTSLESQIDALRSQTHLTVPRMSGGRQSFFEDVVGWLNTFDEGEIRELDVIIPTDPSLALTLPYPRDEISLALTVAKIEFTESSLEDLFLSYGLSSKLITRPTVALSGGERLLLAFLKADILSAKAASLILCSPTQWLFRGNYHYLDKLINKYVSSGKPVTALFLEGEPLPQSLANQLASKACPTIPTSNINWRLTIKELEISYPPARFPMESRGETISYIPKELSMDLKSPTILAGDNGIGKSTFARVLSGQLRPARGFAEASTAGFEGLARYVFQDSIDQLFGESIRDHLSRVFRFDEIRREAVLSLFDGLQEEMANYMLKDPSLGILGNRNNPDTLLQAKLALIAERLTSKPPLLILDEPGWGLSKSVARVMLSSVCAKATAQKTAVLFISHAPDWWSDIAASEITLTRSGEYVQIIAETQDRSGQ
jgi:energy-coupling factor transporter ATP-binding protein EcfA2